MNNTIFPCTYTKVCSYRGRTRACSTIKLYGLHSHNDDSTTRSVAIITKIMTNLFSDRVSVYTSLHAKHTVKDLEQIVLVERFYHTLISFG